jgi:hypothetical protein
MKSNKTRSGHTVRATHRMRAGTKKTAGHAKHVSPCPYASPHKTGGRGSNVIHPPFASPSTKDGHKDPATPRSCAVQSLISLLREAQVYRSSLIRSRIMISNSRLSLVRRVACNFETTLSEKKRKELCAKAQEIVDNLDEGKPVSDMSAIDMAMLAGALAPTRAAVDAIKEQEKEKSKLMEEIASQLPAYDWWVAHPAMKAIGFAMIVGEAGDIGGYDNPGKLWKRFGLAPSGCYKMITKNGKEAIAKPKARCSVAHQVGVPMVNHRKCPYRKVYEERKAYEVAEAKKRGQKIVPADKAKKLGWEKAISKKHIDNRARRYMVKRVLKNLWQAWRNEVGMPSNPHKQDATAGV